MQKNMLLLTMLCAVSMGSVMQAMYDPVKHDLSAVDTYAGGDTDSTKPQATTHKAKSQKQKSLSRFEQAKEFSSSCFNTALPWVSAAAGAARLAQQIPVSVIPTIAPLAKRCTALFIGNWPLFGKGLENLTIKSASSIVSCATPFVTGSIAAAGLTLNVAQDCYKEDLWETRTRWNGWFGLSKMSDQNLNDLQVKDRYIQTMRLSEMIGLKSLALFSACKGRSGEFLYNAAAIALGTAVFMVYSTAMQIK